MEMGQAEVRPGCLASFAQETPNSPTTMGETRKGSHVQLPKVSLTARLSAEGAQKKLQSARQGLSQEQVEQRPSPFAITP